MNGASQRALVALGALALIVVARAGVAMEHAAAAPAAAPGGVSSGPR